MREQPTTNSPARGEQTEPSRERRLLLKAAAATAPLIATLPSGAAFANASTQNCVMADGERSQAAAPNVEVLEPPQRDDYLRLSAWRRTCSNENFYFIEVKSQWYKEGGTAVGQGDVCGLDAPAGDPDLDTKVYVLSHWMPEGDSQDVRQYDFYPVTKLGDSELIGLTDSCMHSMNVVFVSDDEKSWGSRA